MSKKIVVILIAGMVLLSACNSATPTEEVLETATESPSEEGRMPCSSLFNYETSEQADFYQAIVDQLAPVTEEDWIYGDPAAPVTIVEYEDFQCPACPGFSLYVKQLVELYPDTFRVVFRHLPLPSIHDKAYISSMAAEAAGTQGMFWEMHDMLYENQNEWTYATEDEFVDWVTAKAESLGLDVAQFETDLFNQADRAALEDTTNERLNLGLNYTPFVVINDRIYKDGLPNLSSLIGYYHFDGYAECPPWVIDTEKTYIAVLDTSVGEIKIELFADAAPLAVNSFIFLTQSGWFDNLYFHRVIEGFVAQTGDPSGLGLVGPGYTFANETNNSLSYDQAGVLGMASSGTDLNGSQFFITLAPATQLDGSYTIFGQVLDESIAVLMNIAVRDPATMEEMLNLEGATLINGIEIIEE